MARNPKWTRDEIILALNVYFKVDDMSKLSAQDNSIVQLSELLKKLSIYEHKNVSDTYRNPNGVLMKLTNFQSIEYPGKGLTNVSKLDKQIFNEFKANKSLLENLSNKITNAITLKKQPKLEIEDEGFIEGAILEKQHKYKERNPTAVKKKKRKVLNEQGYLKCEVCGFVFQDFYGELGTEYIECHHIIPLADINIERATKMEELALVCSNCHRMLHRKRPWITISELKKIVEEHRLL